MRSYDHFLLLINKYNFMKVVDYDTSKDTWNEILKNCDLRTQINLISTCHFMYDHLYNIDSKLQKLLSDTILTQEKFRYVAQLNANNNSKIINISS